VPVLRRRQLEAAGLPCLRCGPATSGDPDQTTKDGVTVTWLRDVFIDAMVGCAKVFGIAIVLAVVFR